MWGCIKASKAKFDHLIEEVTTRSVQYEDVFLYLQVAVNLWGKTLAPCKIPVL